MTKDDYTTLVSVLACAVWALMLAWWFWDYVDAVIRRLPRESLRDAISRAGRERKLDQEAREQMFGSRWATGMASLVCLLLSLLMLTSLARGTILGTLLLCYVGVGLLVVQRYDLRAHASWHRLSLSNRLWFRLTHAWLWPLHLILGREQRNVADRPADDIDSKE